MYSCIIKNGHYFDCFHDFSTFVLNNVHTIKYISKDVLILYNSKFTNFMENTMPTIKYAHLNVQLDEFCSMYTS
jgi:hypothetical protein